MVAIFKGGGAVGVLFATCLIACIVGSVVSNNASALLLYPIVSDLSTTTDGLERREAVLVLMVASVSQRHFSPLFLGRNLGEKRARNSGG